ncbi:MAG: hypothetical protein K0U84_05500 [Actinomycetia bacterium]|nr:hypothetical protein [Actinomycetes bacterium]
MTESPEQPGNETPPLPPNHQQPHGQPNRLNQTLAWVGIVAGVLFIVAAIFFSGLFIGRATGGYYDWHRGYEAGQMQPGGSMGSCPMMKPGGMMKPDKYPPRPPAPTAPQRP